MVIMMLLDRLANIMYKVEVIANQAQLSNNLEQITYIIGSDEFNSELQWYDYKRNSSN